MKQSGIDWIGEIPDGWEVKRFKFIATSLEKGAGITKEEVFEDGDTPCVRYGEIYSKYNQSFSNCISKTFSSKIPAQKYFTNGDILFVGTGELVEEIGKCIAYLGNEKCLAGGDIIIAKHKQNPSFLSYAMNSSYAQNQKSRNKAKLKVVHISATEIGDVQIFLPPLHEQESIAKMLDSKCAQIDSIIEESKKSIEEYKAWKQSVIFEAVTGKLKGEKGEVKMKNSGVEWIGEIPEDWKVVKLRNIGRCQNGISKGSEFFGKGTPFVSYGDVYRNMALSENVTGLIQSTDEEKFRYSVKRGDIFFTRTSETIEEVGIASVCLKTINNACFAGFLIRVRPFNNMIIPEFAKYYFRNIRLRDYFAKEMTLVTRASLSQNLLKELPVVVPPLTSQLSLITFLDSKCAQIDSLIAEKESLIADLTEYKKSLIFEVVTGKRSV